MGYRSLEPVGPLVMSASQVGVEFGWTVAKVFRECDAGRFPGPVNPSDHRRSWRWSRARVRRFVDTGSVEAFAVDDDPTPAHGIVRPELKAVGS